MNLYYEQPLENLTAADMPKINNGDLQAHLYGVGYSQGESKIYYVSMAGGNMEVRAIQATMYNKKPKLIIQAVAGWGYHSGEKDASYNNVTMKIPGTTWLHRVMVTRMPNIFVVTLPEARKLIWRSDKCKEARNSLQVQHIAEAHKQLWNWLYTATRIPLPFKYTPILWDLVTGARRHPDWGWRLIHELSSYGDCIGCWKATNDMEKWEKGAMIALAEGEKLCG